jgi:tetratricopeptide (TPR) repeat protein
MTDEKKLKRVSLITLFFFFWFTLETNFLLSQEAQIAEKNWEEAMEKANSLIAAEDWDAAKKKLNAILKHYKQEEIQAEAYFQLARVHFLINDSDKRINSFLGETFRQDPQYKGYEKYEKEEKYKALFERVAEIKAVKKKVKKKEPPGTVGVITKEENKKKKKKVLWIVGAVAGVIVGVILYILTKKKNGPPPLPDIEITTDDDTSPAQPFAVNFFVLDEDKAELRISEGENHKERPTLKVDVHSIINEAILVFQYNHGSIFPSTGYSFFVKNMISMSGFEIELKDRGGNTHRIHVANLPEGEWRKITLGGIPARNSWDISEILIHFKNNGILLIDGIKNH